MKTFVLLACVIVLVQGLTDEQKAKLQKHQSDCISESGVDLAAVKKLRAGDYKTETDGLKSFTLCILIKSELMTKEGKFRKDIALAKIPVVEDRPEVGVIIDSCLSHVGTTPEENAWNFTKCYHAKNPKHPIL